MVWWFNPTLVGGIFTIRRWRTMAGTDNRAVQCEPFVTARPRTVWRLLVISLTVILAFGIWHEQPLKHLCANDAGVMARADAIAVENAELHAAPNVIVQAELGEICSANEKGEFFFT